MQSPWNALLDVLEDGVLLLDGRGLLACINPAACRALGHEAALPPGQPGARVLSPATLDRLLTLPGAAQGRSLQAFDGQLLHRDGRLLEMRLDCRCVRDAAGEPQLLVRFGAQARQDMDDRHALLASLAKSQAQYRALVENSHEAVLVAQEGVLRYANPAASRMFDLSEKALLGRASIELVHPEDRALVMEKRLLMLTGQLVEPYEARMISPPSAALSAASIVRWSQVYGVRIDWDGSAALLILIADISEQHDLRERLGQALEQHQAILATTAVGVCMLRNRRHQWVNATLCRMLGFEAHELIGQETRIHYPSTEAYEASGRAGYADIARQGSYSAEVEMKRKDGQPVWIQIDGRMLDRGQTDGVSVWTYVDVTHRKAAEAELQQTLARERELGELKTRFVSMASHEFRTPLSTIQTSTELLQHYADRLDAGERLNILGDIQQSVDRMRSLMENFLAFGQMGSAQAECKPAPCDVRSLFEQLVGEARSADGKRHTVTLEETGARVDTPVLMADGALLRQMVGNLLTNACKYSAKGSEVRLAWGRDEGRLRIEVADQGIGIPAADLPRLFETFHRASNVAGIQGTGLGLAIVKRAVDAHGGEIDVRSALGEGSRFIVHLPWHAAPPGAAA